MSAQCDKYLKVALKYIYYVDIHVYTYVHVDLVSSFLFFSLCALQCTCTYIHDVCDVMH